MSALPLKANIAQRGLMLSANSGHHYFIGVLAVFNRIRGIAANKNPKQERNTLARGVLRIRSRTRYAILGPETVH
jgi:hypothetical protein